MHLLQGSSLACTIQQNASVWPSAADLTWHGMAPPGQQLIPAHQLATNSTLAPGRQALGPMAPSRQLVCTMPCLLLFCITPPQQCTSHSKGCHGPHTRCADGMCAAGGGAAGGLASLAPLQQEDVALVVPARPHAVVQVRDLQPAVRVEDGQQQLVVGLKQLLKLGGHLQRAPSQSAVYGCSELRAGG